ncbi:unnamed protein product [Allacma fusca]|uniref:Uncharacterized protein n=1 Tax=Allacma fusca TaxID=39272 RepID=A0A8J2LI46_9HEXA|nr:unnamed protein product [Allacma fusca]
MIIHSLKNTYGVIKRTRDYLRLLRNEVQQEIDDALEDGERFQNTNAVVNAYLAGKLYAIFWRIRDYDICVYGTDYRSVNSTRLT